MTTREATPLERVLRIFADVRPGEGLRAVLLMVTLFIILSSYYVLKTVREELILAGGTYIPVLDVEIQGDVLKTSASGAMAVLMLGIIPAYGRLASRVDRKRLLDISYALIIVSLAVFFLLGSADIPVGLAFFVWLGIVNMFVIAQFWSYANDLYTEDQGKRLFAIIAIGGTVGAIVGPKLTGLAGAYVMMMIAAGMFVTALLLFGIVERLSKGARDNQDHAPPPLAKEGGFQLVLRDRYLLLIGVMLILGNLVNSIGEFILSNAAREHAAMAVPAGELAGEALDKARGKAIGAFYADFYFWVNLVGFLIQALLVSRIMKAGVRLALLVLPTIALGGYGLIGVVGSLAILRVAKTAENATDYSLQNTVRQSLFLPTSREVKYKAKAALDTFFVRFGDVAAAGSVALGIQVFGFGRGEFAIANVAVCAIWIVVALAIGRAYARLSRTE